MKLQFILALTVAAIDDSWQKLKGIKTALGTKQQVSDELKEKRLAACRECPVFFAPLQTCGSALRKHTGLGIRPGCGCWMPLAASVSHDCWLYLNELDGGWPEELNSFSRT